LVVVVFAAAEHFAKGGLVVRLVEVDLGGRWYVISRS
jgi:hypothetical protein